MEHQSLSNGALIGITAIIWAFATGMLAICIPLVSITNSGIILPLAVIIGASLGTLVFWLISAYCFHKSLELTHTLQSLEQRIADLETNNSPLPKGSK